MRRLLVFLLQGPCKQDALMKKKRGQSPALCTSTLEKVPKIRPTEEPLHKAVCVAPRAGGSVRPAAVCHGSKIEYQIMPPEEPLHKAVCVAPRAGGSVRPATVCHGPKIEYQIMSPEEPLHKAVCVAPRAGGSVRPATVCHVQKKGVIRLPAHQAKWINSCVPKIVATRFWRSRPAKPRSGFSVHEP